MKLFITDLDKTFLKSDLSVGDFSKSVWNEAIKQGYMLSVATARSLKKSLDFLEGLELKTPMILLDGAMVATSNKEIIKLNALSSELSNEVIKIGREFDIEPFIVGFDGDFINEKFLYPHKLNFFQEQLVNSYKNDNRLRSSSKITPLEKNLKIVYMGKKEDMIALEKRLKEVFKDDIEIKNAKDVYFDCYFLTVLHPLGDKAHALKSVLEYCGVDSSDLSVFGDSHNDIGMFKKANKAIAVKNALDEVKKQADIVLPHTNDEEAVAKYLKKEILS